MRRRAKTRSIALLKPSEIQAALRGRLNQLASCTAAREDLRIECPDEGTMRVRKLVHRGAPRPVSKYPSFKLGRVVECESLLEVEFAILLDVGPAIEAFAEQSVVLNYTDGDSHRWHVPDFVVLSKGRIHFVEVKFQRDVDDAVMARTKLLKARLASLGASYRLITEEEIRSGHLLDNARQVLRRGRHNIHEFELRGYHERLRRDGVLTLGCWGWTQTGSREATGIARLIMRGQAWVSMSSPLNAATAVWFHDTEVASWPLDHSV